MFEYFDTETIDGEEVVDVWKDFSIEIDTTDYQFYQLVEGDNLMSISYKFYGNISDWWIIYVFNNLNNINFDLIQQETIQATLDKHENDINGYDDLPAKRKAYINQIVRDFYNVDNDIKTAVQLANEFLFDPTGDMYSFLDFLKSLIITESFYNEELKIPNKSVVSEIKNEFEDFSEVWANE